MIMRPCIPDPSQQPVGLGKPPASASPIRRACSTPRRSLKPVARCTRNSLVDPTLAGAPQLACQRLLQKGYPDRCARNHAPLRSDMRACYM
jgi:hypothetical protein